MRTIIILSTLAVTACGGVEGEDLFAGGKTDDLTALSPKAPVDVFLRRITIRASSGIGFDTFDGPDIYAVLKIANTYITTSTEDDVEERTPKGGGRRIHRVDYCDNGCKRLGTTTIAELRRGAFDARVYDEDSVTADDYLGSCLATSTTIGHWLGRLKHPSLLTFGSVFRIQSIAEKGDEIGNKKSSLIDPNAEIGHRVLAEEGGGYFCDYKPGRPRNTYDRLEQVQIVVVPQGKRPSAYALPK